MASAADRPQLRLLAASAAVVGGLLAGCNYPKAEPFDPATLAAAERAEAEQQPRRTLPPISSTLDTPFLPENATQTDRGLQLDRDAVDRLRASSFPEVAQVELSLQEVIQRTVANSPEVRVAAFDPAIEESRVTEADARFDPVAFAETQLQYNRTRLNQSGGNDPDFTDPGNVILDFFEDETIDVRNSLGLRQQLRSGGQAELRLDSNYLNFDGDRIDTFDQIPESYEQQLVFRLTQPLLRDFGRGVNEARLVINRNNQRVSVLEFRRELERVLREETYWRLRQAVAVVRIQEELLDRTIAGAEQVLGRFGDDAGRLQLAQFNARVESRRLTLIGARAQVRDLSDRLKRLMGDPSLPVAGPTRVLPATEPIEQRLNFDLADIVESALANRAELGEQRLRISSAGTALGVAESNRLPRLDLVLSAGIQGIGQDFGDSWDEFVSDPGFTGGVGLQFEIPLGNRGANAIFVRAHMQRQQAVAQYEALIQQVAEEVSTSLRAVETAYLQIAGARQASLAAADALQALDDRELGGEALSPAFINTKLSQQEQLADAQRSEVQAISEYNIAVANLELAKGTLLRYNNVLLDEAAEPITQRLRR